MISASHSTASPAGPAATQCDLPSEPSVDPVEVGHELRQILEATPEAVDVGDRYFQRESIPERGCRARRQALLACCDSA